MTVTLLGVAGVLFSAALTSPAFKGTAGIDLVHYLDATRRWLETGTPYLASEVGGPFDYQDATYLHPPIALLLLLPFLLLPGVLWWVIPLGAIGWSVWSWRPAAWTWPLLALALAMPRSHVVIVTGNTSMWICAATLLGLRFGWPALLVVIKPSFLPLQLVGVRHRSWWHGLPLVALACLPFGALWLDWIAVTQHAPGDWTYSFVDVPWLLLSMVAWVGRRPESTGA